MEKITIILSAASILIAITSVIVSICTAKKQNRIAMYEKRYSIFETLKRLFICIPVFKIITKDTTPFHLQGETPKQFMLSNIKSVIENQIFFRKYKEITAFDATYEIYGLQTALQGSEFLFDPKTNSIIKESAKYICDVILKIYMAEILPTEENIVTIEKYEKEIMSILHKKIKL